MEEPKRSIPNKRSLARLDTSEPTAVTEASTTSSLAPAPRQSNGPNPYARQRPNGEVKPPVDLRELVKDMTDMYQQAGDSLTKTAAREVAEGVLSVAGSNNDRMRWKMETCPQSERMQIAADLANRCLAGDADVINSVADIFNGMVAGVVKEEAMTAFDAVIASRGADLSKSVYGLTDGGRALISPEWRAL